MHYIEIKIYVCVVCDKKIFRFSRHNIIIIMYYLLHAKTVISLVILPHFLNRRQESLNIGFGSGFDLSQ